MQGREMAETYSSENEVARQPHECRQQRDVPINGPEQRIQEHRYCYVTREVEEFAGEAKPKE